MNEFNQACVDKIIQILTSERCGLEVNAKLSVDGDELFVMTRLPDDVVGPLADKFEVPKCVKFSFLKLHF